MGLNQGPARMTPTPTRTQPMSNEDGPIDYDDDDSECWNCGGDGFVYGCSWDWQCDTWDGDSCLCTRPCHICHPPKENPELRKIMAEALAPKDHPND